MKQFLFFLCISLSYHSFSSSGFLEDCGSHIFINQDGLVRNYNGTNCTTQGEVLPNDLGLVSLLVLTGAEINTFENENSDVNEAFLYYRVYPNGSQPPSFSSLELSTITTLPTIGEENRKSNFSIDLARNVEQFTQYKVDFFFEITGTNEGTFFNKTSPAEAQATNTFYSTTFLPYPVVPIRLSSFSIINTQEKLPLLTWVTESECNASHFELQRSFNGLEYETIETIPTEGGGNSCLGANYEYLESLSTEEVLTSKFYYRLKLVDLEGEFSFSTFLAIDAKEDEFLFYNMLTKELLIDNFGQEFTLRIIDSSGNIQYQEQLFSGTISLNHLRPGFYVAVVSGNNGTVSERIIVM